MASQGCVYAKPDSRGADLATVDLFILQRYVDCLCRTRLAERFVGIIHLGQCIDCCAFRRRVVVHARVCKTGGDGVGGCVLFGVAGIGETTRCGVNWSGGRRLGCVENCGGGVSCWIFKPLIANASVVTDHVVISSVFERAQVCVSEIVVEVDVQSFAVAVGNFIIKRCDEKAITTEFG